MDSRPSGPVVLTVDEKAVLNEGIGLILSRWTAMRAAVDNGWGGRDSHLKAELTVSNVLDYFIRLKGFIFIAFSIKSFDFYMSFAVKDDSFLITSLL